MKEEFSSKDNRYMLSYIQCVQRRLERDSVAIQRQTQMLKSIVEELIRRES